MTYATVRSAAQEIAKRGSITPHQLAALTRLDEALTDKQRQEFTDLWRAEGSPAAAKPQSDWETRVQALNLSQPDAVTCQATCIAMVVRDKDVAGIRRKLEAIGTAGDPGVMGQVVRSYGVNYTYDPDANLEKVAGWLKAGEALITHGWFTRSGHVIVLDGLRENGPKRLLNVKDPWSCFDGPSWSYNQPGIKFYDGFYSELMIYAACVAGSSASDAAAVYRAGKIDRKHGGMWVHRIRP